jgi:hypothetical protein
VNTDAEKRKSRRADRRVGIDDSLLLTVADEPEVELPV